MDSQTQKNKNAKDNKMKYFQHGPKKHKKFYIKSAALSQPGSSYFNFETAWCFFYIVLMHANIAGDSPRWTRSFVYIAIVNSIKSAAAMEMIETWLHGQVNAKQGQTATQCFPVL